MIIEATIKITLSTNEVITVLIEDDTIHFLVPPGMKAPELSTIDSIVNSINNYIMFRKMNKGVLSDEIDEKESRH